MPREGCRRDGPGTGLDRGGFRCGKGNTVVTLPAPPRRWRDDCLLSAGNTMEERFMKNPEARSKGIRAGGLEGRLDGAAHQFYRGRPARRKGDCLQPGTLHLRAEGRRPLLLGQHRRVLGADKRGADARPRGQRRYSEGADTADRRLPSSESLRGGRAGEARPGHRDRLRDRPVPPTSPCAATTRCTTTTSSSPTGWTSGSSCSTSPRPITRYRGLLPGGSPRSRTSAV